MAEHICSQEKEIGEISSLMKRLVSQVYGNGQKGLAVTVPELSIKIDNLTETILLLSTNVSALMKADATYKGVREYKDREALSNRQRAAIYVSAIVGGCGIICTLILKFI